MTKYASLLKKLYQTNERAVIKLGLDNLRGMQKAIWENVHSISSYLDFPQAQYPIVHVAGTNGKGSVCTKVAKALEFGGYRVGLFTSPHIEHFWERIQINGRYIAEEEIAELLGPLFEIAEENQIPATFFELTTLLAMIYFAREKVDIAVFEVGLGGRLDATNILSPTVTAITSIGLDHTNLLGETLGEIAGEKAGIIKEGIPVVLGPTLVNDVIMEIARDKQAPVHLVEEVEGPIDALNAAISSRILDVLSKDFPLSESAREKGLAARPPCRFDLRGPLLEYGFESVIFDVAHNPDSFRTLFERARSEYPEHDIEVVMALSQGRDLETCLCAIGEGIAHYYLVEADNGRCMNTDDLALAFQKLGQSNFTPCKNLEGCRKAFIEKKAIKPRILVVCGSFFIMAMMSPLQLIETV
ncbi:MAG: hypothetical protein CMO81_00465 [Waddliaceae bacterium]|nr:hypothetical protein [Waddliaceae bacterium]